MRSSTSARQLSCAKRSTGVSVVAMQSWRVIASAACFLYFDLDQGQHAAVGIAVVAQLHLAVAFQALDVDAVVGGDLHLRRRGVGGIEPAWRAAARRARRSARRFSASKASLSTVPGGTAIR